MGKNIQNNFEKIITFYPNGEFYFAKGIKAFQRNDLMNAKKYLNRAWQLEPNEPFIVCQLAITLAELEDYQNSNELLNKILNELDPNMFECYYFLANNYAYLGLYKQSIKHAKLYLKYQPDGEYVSDTEELLDVILFEEDEWDIEGLGSENFELENDLIEKQEIARIMLAEGKFSEAILYLTDMIKDFPDFWPAYNNLALAYYYNGNNELAIELVQKVLDENPGNIHALCNLTVFYYYEGKNIQEYTDLLKKVFPISVDHRYKLGVTFAIIKEYQLGFKWLRSILGVQYNNDSSYYYWLSYSAYFCSNERLAIKAWKKVLEIEPEKAGSEPWNVDAPLINN